MAELLEYGIQNLFACQVGDGSATFKGGEAKAQVRVEQPSEEGVLSVVVVAIDMYIVPPTGLKDYASDSAPTFALYHQVEDQQTITGTWAGTTQNDGTDSVIVDNVDFSGHAASGDVTVTVDLTRTPSSGPSLALIGGILLAVIIIIIALIAVVALRARKKRAMAPPPMGPPAYPGPPGPYAPPPYYPPPQQPPQYPPPPPSP